MVKGKRSLYVRTSEQICVSHKRELESIRDDWEKIYQDTSTKSFFLTFDYVNLWYECFTAPDQVRVYRVEDSGKTIGFVPLVLSSLNGFRCLHNLTNDHCFHAGPLVKPGYGTRFQELFMRCLMETQSCWDVFRNSYIYSFAKQKALFADHILTNLKFRWTSTTQPTYLVELKETFAHYISSEISVNAKKNFMRHKNRLAKTGAFVMSHYRDSEALTFWHSFMHIENSGWKGRAGSSIQKTSAKYQDYYQRFVDLLARQGLLHLYFLELDGIKIAGVFGYQEGDVFHWAKTGYDENYRNYAPSNILLLLIIEHLFIHYPEIRNFHMFPWDHGYKHRYANVAALCTEMTIFGKTIWGHAGYTLYKLKQGFINYCRKSPPRTT